MCSRSRGGRWSGAGGRCRCMGGSHRGPGVRSSAKGCCGQRDRKQRWHACRWSGDQEDRSEAGRTRVGRDGGAESSKGQRWDKTSKAPVVLTWHSRRSALRLNCHPAKAGQRQRLAQQRLARQRLPAGGHRWM